MHHVSVEERLDSDGVAEEEPFAPVSLPAVPPAQLQQQAAALRGSSRHSRPLPPPGGARRIQVPVPPPRPEHTLTAGSRPIPPPLVIPQQTVTAKNGAPSSPQSPSQQQITPNSLSSLLPVSGNGIGPSTANWSGVTLTQPRPEPDRERNLYTEAPKKLLPHSNQPNQANQHKSSHRLDSGQDSQPSISVIPTSPKLKSKLKNEVRNESIFCQRCGKCKCEACVRPRKLPQKWLCGGTVLCSKKTVVDGLSCMCCVKGLFYHCTKDSEKGEIDPNKEPCSCTGNQPAARWGIMLPLLPLIPCLLAYPMLGACAKVTESAYAKCTASGCQCQNTSSEALSVASEEPSLIVESQPTLPLEKKQLLKPKPSL